ncbi:MAG: hypothetical protein GXP16_11275 [Gammaproteobacteria bacterium]|nr:hypothetical protein [Gammaproteobacteria bacterium]
MLLPFSFAATILFSSTAVSEYELLDCAKVIEPLSRVACYDSLIEKLGAHEVGEPAPERKFGLRKPFQDEIELQVIEHAVTKVSRNPRGQLVLDLSNNQKWEQADQAKLSIKSGDQVVIRKGFGSSYYLTKSNGSRSLKVRRIR